MILIKKVIKNLKKKKKHTDLEFQAVLPSLTGNTA